MRVSIDAAQYVFNVFQNIDVHASTGLNDAHYVTRREQRTSHHPHYHVHMCVNGNKVKDYKALADKMVPHWSRALGIDETTA
ncbi:MAG: inovirus-type Gp2 protein, partial [Victivallales bacterium]|nr:inovirus-type Gp2 protein [Victivallales bacterium]